MKRRIRTDCSVRILSKNASHRETHSSFSPKQEQGRVSNIKERVHRGAEIKERKNVPSGEIKTRTVYECKQVETDTVRQKSNRRKRCHLKTGTEASRKK